MRQSQLFTKTRKEAPSDEVSKNAQLLIRAGYVYKEMAGVYSYLPLGLRTLNKICGVIRDEMNAIGGQEVFLSALQDPDVWKATDRWSDEKVDAWFKTEFKAGGETGLGFTHEEPLTRIFAGQISSYRDLPRYAYQIQTKFRNETRAKSGIMRGREFLMKDLYSFSRSQEELDSFYEDARVAYENVFRRIGIGNTTYLTFASGGVFSKYSHEFQCVSAAGEDTIYIDEDKRIAINKEVRTDEVMRDLGIVQERLIEAKAIEVGNIFKLGTRFSEPLGLTFKDEDGAEKPVVMGSYGIGPSRLMGVIAEVLSDDKGIVWPESVAPFKYHLVELSGGDTGVKEKAESLYQAMMERGIEVLYDDRDARAGEKFADADLIGIPYRIVVGKHSADEALEVMRRATGETLALSRTELLGG